MGTALKEIEMHKAESLARDEKLAVFVFFFSVPFEKRSSSAKWMFPT